jgi:hypothetical protein
MPACKANPEITVAVNYKQVKNITRMDTKKQMVSYP